MSEYAKWKHLLLARKFDIRIALEQRLKEKNQADIAKDWKSALYLAMLQNSELIEYLNSLSQIKDQSLPLDNNAFEFEI